MVAMIQVVLYSALAYMVAMIQVVSYSVLA